VSGVAFTRYSFKMFSHFVLQCKNTHNPNWARGANRQRLN